MTDKEIENFGKRFGWGLIAAFAQWLVGIFIVMLIFAVISDHFRWGMNSTDNRATGQRSHMGLLTDYGTGCQYLKRGDALAPRMGADGKQICR